MNVLSILVFYDNVASDECIINSTLHNNVVSDECIINSLS